MLVYVARLQNDPRGDWRIYKGRESGEWIIVSHEELYSVLSQVEILMEKDRL